VKQFNSLPPFIQESFENYWRKEFEVDNKLSEYTEQRVNLLKKSVFLNISKDANTLIKAQDKAIASIDVSLNVRRVLYNVNISLKEYCYYITGEDAANIVVMPKYFFESSASQYDRTTNDWSTKLNSIVTYQDSNEISEKLRNALRLLGVATSIDYPDVKFILLTSVLEALVMTKSYKGNISYKLAERIAFLIAQPEQRLKTFDNVTELYNKRSRFIHQDEKQK
jgi:Apea-like HEPN